MKSRLLLACVAVLSLLTACSTTRNVISDMERERLSAKLVHLSSAVDDYFGMLPSMPVDTDSAILHAATRRHPQVLAPEFDAYTLKVQYQSPYGVVLLCSKDGSRAIMEDAGCSDRIDRQVTVDAPCQFTLYVEKSCSSVKGSDLL